MHSRHDQLHGLCNYKPLSINQFTLSCNYLHDCMLSLGTTSIPTFVTQNSQWPFLFLTPTPSSKRPFQSGKIFQHFEGPFFEVESIGLALCQYVTGAGFPDQGLVNCSSITEESIGKSKMKLTWNICVIKLLKGKQFLNIPSTR